MRGDARPRSDRGVDHMASELQSENLILLISQPRAGSTLLQRILAGHPDVHTTAEPWLMLHPVYALREEGHCAEYDAHLALKALRDFCATLEDGQEHYAVALRRMALYLYGTACEQAGKARFLDKTPRYYLIIAELVRIFPESRFIVLLRNPLAVLASILNTWVREHWILLARYRNDLLEAPRRLSEGIQSLGDRAVVVHYESLVTEPAGQVEALCNRLGLDYHPAMLDYGKRPRPEGEWGDPTGIDRHGRAATESLERWLDLGSDSQTRHFAESYLQALGPDLLTDLGYDYAELSAKLNAVPCPQTQVAVSWQSLFAPDDALKKRLHLLELAILEHRRLVYWAEQRFGRFWRK